MVEKIISRFHFFRSLDNFLAQKRFRK
ncbi:hypothetical protein WH47_08058 [Habropoda laboriosa]|uniref:Uncharacterized protein n=1 Tax=Habropoda laboriosa TaxID=597456 RepID=A0A0L7QPT4_9HYME|nr:hypothetical protein WH47_08058 [Habropoda laboriosa]